MKRKNETSKRASAIILAASAGCALAFALCGCGGSKPAFDPNAEIATVSREDGSGTRAAFTGLFGILRKSGGKKRDFTSPDTAVANATAVLLATVASDPHSIGYVSLGSVNPTVRTVAIDGAEPTAANIRSGKYKITHPFNILVKPNLSPVAKDFISFILSAEGQKIAEANGYVAANANAPKFQSSSPKGKVVVSGSSSVTPLMEKLKEAYLAVNRSAPSIEIQQSDSSTGVADARDGACDIGMASRELKDSEKNFGLTATAIALDGIAVIVHPLNPVPNLTSSQVQSVYEGKTRNWSALR